MRYPNHNHLPAPPSTTDCALRRGFESAVREQLATAYGIDNSEAQDMITDEPAIVFEWSERAAVALSEFDDSDHVALCVEDLMDSL